MGGAGLPGAHIQQLRLPGADLLHDSAHVVVGHLDHQQLHGLQLDAVFLLEDDGGPAHLELVALAAHLLDEDGKVQLAPAGDFEGVGGVSLLHPHGHVGLHLLEEAVPQVPGGDVFALPPGKGGVVHQEIHGHGGLVDLHKGQGLHAVNVAGGLADVQVGDAGDGDDVPQPGALVLHPLQALELVQLGDLGVLVAVLPAAADGDGLPHLDGAPLHPADADAAHVVVVVDVGEQHLGGPFQVALGGGHLV